MMKRHDSVDNLGEFLVEQNAEKNKETEELEKLNKMNKLSKSLTDVD
jgi:hypothetical protein